MITKPEWCALSVKLIVPIELAGAWRVWEKANRQGANLKFCLVSQQSTKLRLLVLLDATSREFPNLKGLWREIQFY